MSTATATQVDPDVKHRMNVVAGMHSSTFNMIFGDEFVNLRRSIRRANKEEILNTIEALEACAVDACKKHDQLWNRCANEC